MISEKRKAIEKAVIKLKGNWPSESNHKNSIGYLRVGSDWLYKSEIEGSDIAALVCTRAEFEQVKAEMQNKPNWNDAPEWVNWLAQDKNGSWYFYKKKPDGEIAESIWLNTSGNNYTSANRGKVIGDWRNTLEKRPEQTTVWMGGERTDSMVCESKNSFHKLDVKPPESINCKEPKSRSKWSQIPRVASVIIANFKCKGGVYRPRKCEVLKKGVSTEAQGEFAVLCVDKESGEYTQLQWIDEFIFPIPSEVNKDEK